MLVRRLQQMDVQVYQLNAPLRVPDLRPYLEGPRRRTLPAGTYWIPMAQPQKRFIQAALNEDPYNPTNPAYRVSSWSLPLAYNLAGSTSGASLDPDADPRGAGRPNRPGRRCPDAPPVRHLAPVPATSPPTRRSGTRAGSSGVVGTAVHGVDARRGGIGPRRSRRAGRAGGWDQRGSAPLGKDGQQELIRWVNHGGRLIAWRYGAARLAYALGISKARYDMLTASIDGPMVKAPDRRRQPAGRGRRALRVAARGYGIHVGAEIGLAGSVPHEGERQLPGVGVASRNASTLGNTAVADERFGQGRSIVFSFEPLYGGGSEGTQKILFNAMLGPDPKRSRPTAPVSSTRIASRAGWRPRPLGSTGRIRTCTEFDASQWSALRRLSA